MSDQHNYDLMGRRLRALIVIACLVVGTLALAAPAWAATEITEFSNGLQYSPGDITSGPDGNLWFTGGSHAAAVGKITPSGTITEYPDAYPADGAPQDIATGPDGNLWVTVPVDPGAGTTSAIGKITPSGTLTLYQSGLNSGSYPLDITAGPDGNVWFTDISLGTSPAIGKITPSGTITEYSAGLQANNESQPSFIVAGPDGNLWFTDLGHNGGIPAIGKITPSGTITEYSAGLNAGGAATAITAGPDGNLWFTDGATAAIGKITPSGAITEYSSGLTAGSRPFDIAAGPDGNLWFTEDVYGTVTGVGMITPNGAITEYSSGLNSGSAPLNIAAGPDRNLWFTDQGTTPAIGRVNLPAVRTSSSSVSFGNQVLASTSAAQTVTVTNTGGIPLVVGTLATSGTDGADFTLANDTCGGQTLSGGGQCSVDIRFTPSAAGSRTASLDIPSSATSSPDHVALSGTGTTLADVGVAISGPASGTAGSKITYLVTVSNAGPTLATNVVMTEQVPNGTKFQSVSTTQGGCTHPAVGATSGMITCSLGNLLKGANALDTVSLKLTLNKGGNVTDIAQANSTTTNTVPATPDPNLSNNNASLSTTVTK